MNRMVGAQVSSATRRFASRPQSTTGRRRGRSRSGSPARDCVHSESGLRRASGNLLETDVDAFGQRALFYDGVPLIVDDFISDTQVQGSSGATTSSVYAVKFGQGTGIMGLEHGGISVEPIGELETKDATRTRIKWYCGLAVFSELGVARVRGILP